MSDINFSKGEGWQGFQRKERRLEGESEMGSTVICIQQDASNLSKNYQRLNKTLNPRATADSLFFCPKQEQVVPKLFRLSCFSIRLAARFGH